jgi:hypothetical protein
VPQVEWIAVPDGEYGEHTASIMEHQVTIYSDREGENWYCQVDDEEYSALDADDLSSAKKAAYQEIMKYD